MKDYKEFEGKLFDLKVKASPYVDKNSVYIINPENYKQVVKMDNFKPYSLSHKIKRYFITLIKAIMGKI